MTDHDFTKMTLSFFAADALFNQSTNNQPFNLMTCLRGNNADHTASTRGTVQGNIRRRGVSPPKLPIPAVQNPEAAPGRYIMAFFTAGTQSLIRTDYFYTQPSYNADGSLTTNYIISGVPAGTYDVVVAQQPISDGTKLDTLWDISTYPFADFVPSTIPNVVVTSGGITTLNARLEHLADIASEDGTFNPDGVVGLDDLGRLSLAFDTKLGDDLYDPGADLVGTVDPILNPMGLPDNAVNLDDLGALSFFFDVLTTREP